MHDEAAHAVDPAVAGPVAALSHAAVECMEQFEDGMADTVISNSLLHHLEEPRVGLEAAVRLTRNGGRLFIRDLARPETEAEIESIVQAYSGKESENGQQLFRQSLHAALTLNEIRIIARGLGIPEDHVQMTSDRHWTIDWCRPA